MSPFSSNLESVYASNPSGENLRVKFGQEPVASDRLLVRAENCFLMVKISF